LKRGTWEEFIEDWKQLSNGGGMGGPLRLVSVDSFIDGDEE